MGVSKKRLTEIIFSPTKLYLESINTNKQPLDIQTPGEEVLGSKNHTQKESSIETHPFLGATVDGRNPKQPPGMQKTL